MIRTHFAALLAAVTSLLVFFTPTRADAAGAMYLAKGGTELPLERTDVAIDVAGPVVSGTVMQRFRNPQSQPIEVVYAFPLPQRAAVDAMEMKIGTRTVTATIARRDVARSAYVDAVRQGRRAALLEQERPNIFTFSVGNIDAGATVDVRLHYFEVANWDHGTYELAVPTTIGPRYIPGLELGGPQSGTGTKRDTDRVPDAALSPAYARGSGATLAVRVHLDGGATLDAIETPSYGTEIARPSATVADIRLKDGIDIPDRDFVLRWRLTTDTFAPAIFTHRTKTDAPGYLTLMLAPKDDVAVAEVAPRELVFLLDTSGSMHGAPLDAAVRAVHRAIDGLGPNDTFQIIDFADRASAFSPQPLPSTAENRARGHAYIANLRASGGTNQLAGIHAALAHDPRDESRVRYVMFMTDGFIGNDAQVIALTRKEIGQARIFSFGVGSSVNRYLLDEVAIAGRG